MVIYSYNVLLTAHLNARDVWPKVSDTKLSEVTGFEFELRSQQ